MRHTIIISSIAAVVASVLTTVAINGSLFGAGTASSADAPGDLSSIVQPRGVEGIIQGDVDCGKSVTPVDSLKILRHDAGLSVQQDEPCPDIGTLAAIPGPAGPAGPQGEQGPLGPEGAPASGGLSELEYVVVETDSNTDATKTVTATCPDGKKSISGGYDIAGATDVVVQRNVAGGGWFVKATKLNFSLQPWSLAAQVHCAVFGD